MEKNKAREKGTDATASGTMARRGWETVAAEEPQATGQNSTQGGGSAPWASCSRRALQQLRNKAGFPWNAPARRKNTHEVHLRAKESRGPKLLSLVGPVRL